MNAINPRNTFQVPQLGIYNARVHEFVLDRAVGCGSPGRATAGRSYSGHDDHLDRGLEPQSTRRFGDVTTISPSRASIQPAGKPLAVLVNFTAHPTFMSGEDMLFSGDWPGHLQRTIESLIGEGVTAMYYNGAEGDQAPLGRAGRGQQPLGAGRALRPRSGHCGLEAMASDKNRQRRGVWLITRIRSHCPSAPGIPTS